MTTYDVFNGDADGILALHQMRLEEPVDSKRVTGVKRDLRLLSRVHPRKYDRVFVFDIALHHNLQDLLRLLKKGVSVHYFDHHFSGRIPRHPLFFPHIDTASEQCTSLIVDKFLRGRHRLWAIAAAFGDNLNEKAARIANQAGLSAKETRSLAELGRSINYNGYGETLHDIHIHPEDLYKKLRPYADPFRFMRKEGVASQLRLNFKRDMALARRQRPMRRPAGIVVIQPDRAWSRRVRGVLANDYAERSGDKAVAVLTPRPKGDYMVSVRSPMGGKRSAHSFCSRFASGGGRAAAAGIDRLPRRDLDRFMREFDAFFAR